MPPSPTGPSTGARLLTAVVTFVGVATLVACGPRPVTIKRCSGESVPTALVEQIDAADPGAALLAGVETFEVAGIPVILKKTPGKPVVAAGLYVRGGSHNLTPQNAGIESALFSLVAEGGSETLGRDAMHFALDMLGAAFGQDAGKEYSQWTLQVVRQNWDQAFAVFTDVVLHPALPQDEFERQRTRSIEFLKSLPENPDRYVSVLGQDLVYQGQHPYALRQWGTVENLEALTLDDLRSYHAALMTRSRLLFVVVGDLTRAELEAQLADWGALPEGSYTPMATPPYPPAGGDRLARYDKDIPTSYVLAYFHAPAPTNPDYYPMVVATAMLRARLFEKVRTKLDLSYAVAAGLADLPANLGYLYATSSYPSQALAQVYDEVESMQDWLVNEKELRDTIAVFVTDTTMQLETQGAQRNLLADAQLQEGDYRTSAEFIRGVRSVTAEDIRRVMQTYVKDLQIGYYGSPERLGGLFTDIDPARLDERLLEQLGQPGPDHEAPEATAPAPASR